MKPLTITIIGTGVLFNVFCFADGNENAKHSHSNRNDSAQCTQVIPGSISAERLDLILELWDEISPRERQSILMEMSNDLRERFREMRRQSCQEVDDATEPAVEGILESAEVELLMPGNLSDWSISGLENGIPIYTNVTDAADYGVIGDGVNDDQPAIQAALDAAVPYSIVYLPTGTFRLTATLVMPANVVLQGDGPELSHLVFDFGESSIIPIRIESFDRGNYVSLLSGYEKGSTVLTVADGSAFTIGQHIEVEQDNDADIMYTSADFDQVWAERSVGELAVVVSISANTVTLDRPLRHEYFSDRSPAARRVGMIEGVGLQNLSIDRIGAGVADTIRYTHAYNCWIRNIESSNTVVAHVWIYNSSDIEIRSSYFHGSFDFGGGGRGYGVVCGEHTVDCLIEDNVFDTLRHAMMVKQGAAANVFGYNYSINPTWPNTGIPADISLHGHYPSYNLFEGNIVQHIDTPDYWGPCGPGNTFYRNHVETDHILITDESHGQNVIANVLTGSGATLVIDSTVLNTQFYMNLIEGTVDVDVSGVMPDSLYYLDPPIDWGSNPFPSIGVDASSVYDSNPARDRFLSGTPVLPM